MKPKPNENQFLILWERAARHERGLKIITDTPKEVAQQLYKTRQLHPNPEFQNIRVCFPNGGGQVWMVKDTVDIL